MYLLVQFSFTCEFNITAIVFYRGFREDNDESVDVSLETAVPASESDTPATSTSSVRGEEDQEYVSEIGWLTSHATIFQLYMWRQRS